MWLELRFDVQCAKCKGALKVELKQEDTTIKVEPCKNCLDDRYDEGYDGGYQDTINEE